MNRVLFIIIGCFITSIGTVLLQHSHLVIGGTAGLSLSLSYILHIPFSLLFFVVNIPFYIFAVLRMGWNFTLATFMAISVLSGIAAGMEMWLVDFFPASWIGAVVGGVLAGGGLAILFANRSSLGGANIFALYLKDRYGWNPGITNCIFDGIVVLSGVYSVGLEKGFFSVLAVIIISSVIGWLQGRVNKLHLCKLANVSETS